MNLFFGNSYLHPPRRMALVANIGGDLERGVHRHVGTGDAMEMYLALELADGTRQLYRGGVYSLYEFDEPQPLTDDSWRKRVGRRQTGPLVSWTQSYVAAVDSSSIAKRLRNEATISTTLAADMEATFDLEIGRALIERLAHTDIPNGSAYSDEFNLLLRNLARYRETDLLPSIRKMIFGKLLSLPCGDEQFGSRGVCGRLLYAASQLPTSPSEYHQLLDWIVQPPTGAHRDYPLHMADILRRKGSKFDVQFLKLLAHPGLHVRRAAVHYNLLRRRAPNQVALNRHLKSEPNERLALLILGSLALKDGAVLEGEPPTGALRFADHNDERTRAHVAKVLGLTASEEAVPALVKLVKDTDRTVYAYAAPALGLCVRTTRDNDLRVQAIALLGTYLGRDSWTASYALEGLAAIGDSNALVVVHSVASDADYDKETRKHAIQQLMYFGAPALPTLYRLCFDESLAGVAAQTLDTVLVGDEPFGEAEEIDAPPYDRSDLARHRKKARELGYAPKATPEAK